MRKILLIKSSGPCVCVCVCMGLVQFYSFNFINGYISIRCPEKHLLLLHWLHQSLRLCGSQQTVEKILQEMEIPDHLTCLLRNIYADQEATVRTGHETMDWFKIGKEICQGCILSLCLLSFMKSASCEMPGWMNHTLQSRLPGEIATTSDMQMIPP